MTVRRVAILFAALPVALILGCERQPGLQIATDHPARDAGAERRRRTAAHRPPTRRAAIGQGPTRSATTDIGQTYRRSVPRLTQRRPTRLLSTPRARTVAGSGASSSWARPWSSRPRRAGSGSASCCARAIPASLALRVRDEELSAWSDLGPPLSPAVDIAQWTVDGLAPGRRYVYEVSMPGAAGELARGRPSAGPRAAPSIRGAPPPRPAPGTPFTFALIADSHIEPRDPVPPGDDRHRRLLRDDGDHAARRHG